MLLEATIAMLTLMFGMWSVAVWASFKDEHKGEIVSISTYMEKRKAA